MITLIRVLVITFLLAPPVALGAMHLVSTSVPVELLVVTIVASLLAIICWAALTGHFSRLHYHAQIVQKALENDDETVEALVEPLQAKPLKDPVYQSLLDLAERVAKRRHQIRSTVEKVGGIIMALSQNKPLEMNTSEFDVPDAEDNTLLLGSLCQLISSLQHSRQRGDVFANVLRESPIAMMITDPAFRIRSMNPAAEKLLGYPLQKVMQHSIMEFFTPPPIKSHQTDLKKVVLHGKEAIQVLQQGRQEVFTTIATGYGKVQLIGMRASFGTHCLFVIRERSKDKVDMDLPGADTIHFDDVVPTIPMKTPVVAR